MTFLPIVVAVSVAIIAWLIRAKRSELNASLVLTERDYILVTGCDSGVGFALASHLQAERKVRVLATCVQPDGRAASVLRSLGASVVHLDLTKDDVKSVCEEIDRIIGPNRLHAIVNNAGVCIMAEFDWLTDAQLQNMLTVNLGAIRLLKGLMHRILSDKSRILNVSSVNGVVAFPGLSVYSASKFALEGFSDALAMETAKFGVKVIKVRLGDFAKITSIMSAQRQHAEAMWNAFTEQQRARYGSYFEDYMRMVISEAGALSVGDFGALIGSFDRALFAVHPLPLYTAGHPIYLFVIRMLTWLPEGLRNGLIQWTFNKALADGGVQFAVAEQS